MIKLLSSKTFWLVSSFLMLNASMTLKAQDFSQGFDLLFVSTDARSVSLADANTALSVGPSSWLANPANTLFDNKSSVQATYHSWINDISYQYAGAVFRERNRAIGFAIYSNAISDIEVRSVPGQPVGNFSVNYVVVSGGYAKELFGINTGISASWLNEQYLEQNATGYALNLGLSKAVLADEKLILGASLNHVGRMQRLNALRTELPSQAKIGLRSEIVRLNLTSGEGQALPLSLTTVFDVVYALDQNNSSSEMVSRVDNDLFFNTGLELKIGSIILVRGGYKSWDATRKWSFGLGFRVNDIQVDLAQIPFNDGFGNAWSASLRYFF
jgi:hypothetical protein